MNDTTTAVGEPPLAVVQEVYDAFARRDVASVLSRFSSGIEIVQSRELPWGGEYRGHEGAREFFRQLGENLDSTLLIERLIRAADHVVAVGRTRGTAKGTGRPYDVPIAHVWKVQRGRVVRVEFYIDHPSMLPVLQVPKK